MTNQLYAIPVRVKNTTATNMPDEFAGAVVSCFVAAENHEQALGAAVKQLGKDGYQFDDVIDEIQQLDLAKWDEYVATAWADHAESLPDRKELLRVVESGEQFYGPFLSYKE